MAVPVNMPEYDEERAQAFAQTYSEIVQRTWTDAEFKQRYLDDPAGVLREAGLEIPDEMQVKVVEHEPHEKEGVTVLTMPLPAAPKAHLEDEELLEAISGGSSCAASNGTMSTASCPACTAGSAGTAGSAC